MQNEEFQHVFNISENQNHRYNGSMLPYTNEKATGKIRKLSPKKKNNTTDMVTALNKPTAKRRPKSKNCLNADGIVNGFPTSCLATTTVNTREIATKVDFDPYADNFDASPSYSSKFNNFIRSKSHYPAERVAELANKLVAKVAVRGVVDTELNRKRLANLCTSNSTSGVVSSSSSGSGKYEVLNHLSNDALNNQRHCKASSPSISSNSLNFSRLQQQQPPQHNHATNEFGSKAISSNNVSNRHKVITSYLQMTPKCVKRPDESCDDENDYSNYLPDSLPPSSTSTATISAPAKSDVHFIDSRKKAELQQQQKHNQQLLVDTKKISESSASIGGGGGNSSKLFLRAKRRKQSQNKWQMDGGTRHEALQRIREGLDVQDKLQNDLFPLNVGETGFEKSDSDSSEEYANTFQDNWFHMSEIEFDDVKRNIRLAQLYNELQRQLSQIKQNKCDLPILTKPFMKSVVDAARTRPVDVMHCVEDDERQRLTTVEPLILRKKKCGAEGCKNVALPCMPTCVRHILLCEKQTLFEQCRVRHSNSFQCDRPVLNIKYHYPVCSLHSKPDFVLPDFSREDNLYEDVRGINTSTSHAELYKTDFDLTPANITQISAPASMSSSSTKCETTTKKRNNVNSNAAVRNHVNASRPSLVSTAAVGSCRKEKEKKAAIAAAPSTIAPAAAAIVERKENKPSLVRRETVTKPTSAAVVRTTKEQLFPNANVVAAAAASVVAAAKKQTTTTTCTAPPPLAAVPEDNQNLIQDWVANHLVDSKTLETNLSTDFVNGFDINAPSIESHLQELIKSEPSLTTDILLESHDLPSYIQVEEMIEEVEVTDETLESNNQELVPSEDLNAVLKQLPPEAFNELFSDKNDSQWTETQALERVIEEMDVQKCALIDPSLLLEDIEPSYSNYSNSYDASLSETVDTKFNNITGNCSQSES